MHSRGLDVSSATAGGIDTRSVSTCAGSVKPGSTWRIAWKVRIIRPEATSRTTASATSTTTSVLRARCRALPALDERPPSFKRRASCGLANLRTGKSPNSSPATSEITTVNASTSRIDGDLVDTRQAVWCHRDERADARVGQAEAGGAAEERRAPGSPTAAPR